VTEQFTHAVEPLRAQLQSLLSDVADVSTAVISTLDGLVVATAGADTVDTDSLAALAAATSGVGSQFTYLMRLGELAATVVYGSYGSIAVHPIGDNAILLLHAADEPNVARLHLAIRQAVPTLQGIMQSN
jgi:uncharacterized protein